MRDLRLVGSPEPSRREAARQPPMPLLRTTVGDVLRRIRLEQGRTLADVARSAKVSMPYLSELERGRKEASSEILAAICTALGIGLTDLIELVSRDLAAERDRRSPVFRLERATRDGSRRQPDIRRGSGDIKCLLAA
ncbi:MAG TPA: helix-turn-helix domain-containing protein [Streptosporangiaceae bacterium]|nr:helix-turn-helix domain-containing protein [Streptosporangiaceae bacterium]